MTKRTRQTKHHMYHIYLVKRYLRTMSERNHSVPVPCCRNPGLCGMVNVSASKGVVGIPVSSLLRLFTFVLEKVLINCLS